MIGMGILWKSQSKMNYDFIFKKMKQIHRQLCKINDEFIYSK